MDSDQPAVLPVKRERAREQEEDPVNIEPPLLNIEVVEHILDCLARSSARSGSSFLREFARFRGVCNSWNNLSLKKWRSCVAIRLGLTNNEIQNVKDGRPFLPVSDFIDMLINPNVDPYQLKAATWKSFVLDGVDFTSDDLPQYLSMFDNSNQNFWNLMSSQVDLKAFKFVNCTFGYQCFLLDTLIITKLSNTHKLSLKYCTVNFNYYFDKKEYQAISRMVHDVGKWQLLELQYLEIEGETPSDMSLLMACLPNLKSLKIRNGTLRNQNLLPYHANATNWTICKTLRIPFKLKELDIMHTIFFSFLGHYYSTEVYLSLLLSWPLTSLCLNVSWSQLPVDALNMILIHFAGSLQTLKLFRSPLQHVDDPILSFDGIKPMEALKELHVLGNVTRNLKAFLKYTPNLQILKINITCIDQLDFLFENYKDDEATKLKLIRTKYQPYKIDLLRETFPTDRSTLQLPHMRELDLVGSKITCNIIQYIARWMPDLKKFRGNFLRRTFRSVCSLMKDNLEELVVSYGSKMDDATITGRVRGANGLTYNADNVTALRCLRRFRMEGLCQAGRADITDSSVSNGFLLMSSLRDVELCVTGTGRISEEAENQLKTRIGANVLVHRYYVNKCLGSEKEVCSYKLAIFYQEILCKENEIDDGDQ